MWLYSLAICKWKTLFFKNTLHTVVHLMKGLLQIVLQGFWLKFMSHRWDDISHKLYHKSRLIRCSVLEESLSMYGRVWSFIKTIIFALFVMTCKMVYQNLFDIQSLSILQLYQKWLNYWIALFVCFLVTRHVCVTVN